MVPRRTPVTAVPISMAAPLCLTSSALTSPPRRTSQGILPAIPPSGGFALLLRRICNRRLPRLLFDIHRLRPCAFDGNRQSGRFPLATAACHANAQSRASCSQWNGNVSSRSHRGPVLQNIVCSDIGNMLQKEHNCGRSPGNRVTDRRRCPISAVKCLPLLSVFCSINSIRSNRHGQLSIKQPRQVPKRTRRNHLSSRI